MDNKMVVVEKWVVDKRNDIKEFLEIP